MNSKRNILKVYESSYSVWVLGFSRFVSHIANLW